MNQGTLPLAKNKMLQRRKLDKIVFGIAHVFFHGLCACERTR
jgi:hypothetical protein